MTRKSWMWVLLSLILLFSLACNFISGGGETETPPPPPPPPVSEGGSGGGTTSGGGTSSSGGGFTITLVNKAPMDICYVFISPSTSDSWNDDWLGSDETIAPGASRSFEVPQDTFDVMVSDCNSAVMATFWEIDGPTTLTVGKPGAHVLTVENDSSTEVCFIYIDPSTSDTWSDDWLGEKETIPTGHSRYFFVDPGTYDFLAADCDGNELASEYGVKVDDDITWTLSDN